MLAVLSATSASSSIGRLKTRMGRESQGTAWAPLAAGRLDALTPEPESRWFVATDHPSATRGWAKVTESRGSSGAGSEPESHANEISMSMSSSGHGIPIWMEKVISRV